MKTAALPFPKRCVITQEDFQPAEQGGGQLEQLEMATPFGKADVVIPVARLVPLHDINGHELRVGAGLLDGKQRSSRLEPGASAFEFRSQ